MTDNVVSLFQKAVSKVTAVAILGSAMAFSTAASAEEAADSAAIPVDPVRGPSAASAVLGEADPAFSLIFDKWSGQGKKEEVKLTIPSMKPVKNYRLTSNYGFRSDPFGRGRRAHKGVDMAGPVGTRHLCNG